MRKLAAVVVIGAALILQGCASLQKYPAFSAQPGGRIITADRSGVTNLLPATSQVRSNTLRRRQPTVTRCTDGTEHAFPPSR